MPSVIVTKRDLWPPNMVKSMQLLDAVLREQNRATVMDPRGGIVPHVLVSSPLFCSKETPGVTTG